MSPSAQSEAKQWTMCSDRKPQSTVKLEQHAERSDRHYEAKLGTERRTLCNGARRKASDGEERQTMPARSMIEKLDCNNGQRQ